MEYHLITAGVNRGIKDLCPAWQEKKEVLLSEPDVITSMLELIENGSYEHLGPMTCILKTQQKCYKWIPAPLTPQVAHCAVLFVCRVFFLCFIETKDNNKTNEFVTKDNFDEWMHESMNKWNVFLRSKGLDLEPNAEGR